MTVERKLIVKSLKSIRSSLDSLIDILEPPPTPTSELWHTHFQWLIPYFDYTGVKHSRKYYAYFQDNGYTHNSIIKVKQATEAIINSVGVLCCPLPIDPIIGFSNTVSFHPKCVKMLISFIVRHEEAREDYLDIFRTEEAENRLSHCRISKKEVDSIHFDLLDKDKFNRFALNTIYLNYMDGKYGDYRYWENS